MGKEGIKGEPGVQGERGDAGPTGMVLSLSLPRVATLRTGPGCSKAD